MPPFIAYSLEIPILARKLPRAFSVPVCLWASFLYRKSRAWFIIVFLFAIGVQKATGQTCTTCDAAVPAVTIDFSNNPDTSTVISGIPRNGHCCSASGGNRCIRFYVTVNPQTANVSFETSDHGVSGFYQINCGPSYSTGSPQCIAGLTSFCITYCKNGGDAPDYTIKVSRGFGTSSDVSVRGDGTCPKQLTVSGLDEASIVWNSIGPGLPGTYNSYLNTTVGSDTVLVNPTSIPPGGYIDYRVCGQSVGCSTANICDTVRVYVYSNLTLNLTPANPVICTGSAGTGSTTINAALVGGKPPFSYSWTGPGGFTSTLASPTVNQVGDYICTARDSLGCTFVVDTLTVTSNLIPDVNSNATGSVCSGVAQNYSLSSSVSSATFTWSRAAVAGISNPGVSGQTSSSITETLNNTTGSAINVTYVVTPNNGVCAGGVFTYTVTVYPRPTVAFSTNNISQCLGSNVFTFTNTSTLGSTYLWDFGDGSSSSNVNPSHTYTVAGSFAVKLVVTSANGCKDSTFTSVTVINQPTSSFTINNGSQCVNGNNFSFTSTSTANAGTITAFNWSFGDGGTSSIQNPTHTYASAGSFQVKLVITTSNGCKDSSIQTVIVYPKPTPAFSVNSATQCLNGNSFAITNNSTIASGTIASYQWSFGDGGTSTLQNPNYNYTTAGTYTIKLVVKSNNGCKDSITQSVTIYPRPTGVAININPAAQCLSGNNFSFSTNATVSSGTLAYVWNFGDGGTSTLQNPNHTYATAGSYPVKLVVTSNNGCKDSTTQTVTVLPQPVAAFNINNSSQCLSGNNFSFTNSSTIASGSISNYAWSFGDGGISSLQSPTHSYTAAGTYTIKLVVTSTSGCKDSTTQNITLFPQASSTSIGVSPTAKCLSGNSFSFTGNASVSGGSISSYSWNFGDGGTSSLQNPTHSYITAGSFVVKLIVTTNNGCKDSATQSITVYPQPIVGFATNANPQCLSNNNFIFTNTSTISSGSLSYAWTFGDGGASTAQHPVHNYSTPGTYPVSLIVTSNNGCIDSIKQNAIINFQPSNVAFGINATTQCYNGNSFSFTSNASVTNGTVTYAWSFGDGATSTLQNPTHSYAAAGIYNIKLVVTTNNSCKDSSTQTVTVYPQAIGVSFTANNANQCLTGNSFAFASNASVSGGTVTYAWIFGDGGTSTLQNPTHSYTAAGAYIVKLVITSNSGCKDSTTQTVTVNPQPVAAFTTNGNPQCLSNNAFVFTNTSAIASGSIVAYNWNFGNGNTSTAQNPSISYTSAGTYTVKLVVTSNNGCKDSTTQTITVYPSPTGVSFNINDASQCLSGNSFAFTTSATISSGTLTYAWTFGDGGTSTLQNPTHTYASAGTYQIKLVVTSNNGCKDSVTNTVTVLPQPVASFTTNNIQQCYSNNVFNFTNTSTIGSGTIVQYNWSFGDGATSVQQNPSHTYAASGTYQVKLVTTSDNGCKDSSIQTITVNPQPAGVTFSINNSSQCFSGNNFSFTASASVSSGSITSYNWSFGDGTFATGPSATHTYTAAGVYQVKLVVTTNLGCKDSIIQNVTGFPQPTASFTTTGNNQCLSSNAIAFTNTSTISSGSIASYNWSFGDGGTSTTQSPSHVYATAGTYAVKLVITSDNGCKDSTTQILTINPSPTNMNFSINAANQCLTGNNFSFTTNATAPSGVTYQWSLGDGGSSTLQNPSHSYTVAGTYHVTLVVTTSLGCKDSVSQNIIVYPQPTGVIFTINSTTPCVAGNSFSFNTNAAVNPGTVTYLWNFGDGGTSTLQNPSHTYATNGTYPITLVITTNNGCKDSTMQNATLFAQPTGVDFSINTANQCLSGNNFAFTTNATVSTGTITYNWNFGDGGTSTIQNPNHSYTTAGSYTVELIIETSAGCKDTSTHTVTVYPQPTTAFAISNNQQCLTNNSFSFTNSSTISSGSITNYNWNFGSGQTSNVQNPTNIYTTAGNYTVQLVTTSNNGCKDSITKPITVFAQASNMGFNINNSGQCLSSNSFAFTPTATVTSGTLSYSWSFGDGQTTTTQNPTHSYISTGTYIVKLIITTNNGCMDSISKPVTVYASPTGVSISSSSGTQCYTGNNFQFSTNATVSTGSIAYSWTFGDGGSSTVQNPSYAYAAPGTYTVKLVVTTNQGCKDSATQTVTVFAKPIGVSFTVSNSNQCLSNNNFVFTSNASVPGGTVTYNWNFGDGQTATTQNPTHSYAAAGNYLVKLIITTSNGCIDSSTQSITVYPQSNTNFSINNNQQCLSNNSFTFQSTSTIAGGTIAQYNWTFGDGGSSTLQNPTYTYASAGNYTVTLVTTTNNGCKDSITKSITVFAQASNMGFNINNSGQCLSSNSFAFASTATVTSGTLSYSWIFGDGQTATIQNPTHSYTSTGTYIVKLVVTTSNGCMDSISKPVTVYTSPTGVSISSSSGTQCYTGNNFQFSTNANVSTGSIAYSWTFGDGGSSTVQNPSYAYAAPGTYTVKLVVTTNQGCKDSATQTVTVFAKPIGVSFTVSNSSQCLSNNNFVFTSNASVPGGTVTYNWNFGDGQTSTTQNPIHSYAAAGNYLVKLIITTNNGCIDSSTQSITVYPQSSTNFSINNNQQCLSNNSFTFQSSSTIAGGTIAQYNWTFGDSGSSTLQNPTYTYASAGNYTVTLVTTTNNGCKDSITKPVTIYVQPVAAFTMNANPQCLSNNNFSFTNTSTISSGTISYSWNFGDGQTATAQNPTHNYVTAGTYQVKLLVTSNNGCLDSITHTITVYAQPTSVSIAVNNNTQCFSGNSFAFTTTANVGGGTVTYAWTFGDGGTSTLQNPTYTYTTPGTYNVKLIVTSNNGCTDSATTAVTIYTQPIAGFTTNANPQCYSTNNFSFTNTSTIASGSITSYAWTFGDGGTSTAQNPTHIFTGAGNYQVKLVVTSNNGCKDSSIQTIIVNPQPTGATYTINTTNQCLSGNSYTFTTSASVPNGNVSYAWNFGDGQTSTTQNPTHTYATAGNYSVTLVVTTNLGCKGSTTLPLTVFVQPTANFTTNNSSQCLTNNNFSFTNTSTISSGSITSYSWSFGDGGTSTLQNPTHAFTTAGTYQIKLVVTSNNDCKDSIIKSITVSPQPLPVNISINAGNQCLSGNSFTFTTNASVPTGSLNYLWSFGDGATATTSTATHTYTTAGTYTIKLVLTTNNGCIDSTTTSITVYPQPTAGFTINNNPQCLSNNNFSFTNTSTIASGSIIAYNWSFGDGGTAAIANPSHNYLLAGTYNVKLVITTNNGCKDSTTQTITVYAQPTNVNIAVNNGIQCLSSNNFAFTSNASVGSGTITYAWTFGDGGNSVIQNPTHVYTAIGQYNIKLLVTTNNGCKDSATTNVTVNPDAKAEITYNNQQGCAPYAITGSNIQIVDHPAENISYQWFANGMLIGSSNTFPGYNIANAGDTVVFTLKAISRYGCLNDSTTVKFWTVAKPNTNFTLSDSVGCGPLTVAINNTTPSTNTFQYIWNFGQGQTSTQTQPGNILFLLNPNYRDTAYNITLKAYSICDTVTLTKTVRVKSKPHAAFTPSVLTGCSPIAVNFTNNSVGTNIQQYTWLFGDGGTQTTTGATPVSHTYNVTANTTFSVKLIAVNDCGSDTATIPILVKPDPININIQVNNSQTSGCVPLTVSFTNASSGATSYSWNFGDGATQTTTTNGTVTHTYTSVGNYTVTVIATDNCAYDTLQIPVYVLPLPTIGFTLPTSPVCIGTTVVYNNSSTQGLNYQWNFGDGYSSTLYLPTHSYTAAGTYTVTLTVTRPGTTGPGCSVASSQQITVVSQMPGNFTMNNSNGTCLPFTVNFINQNQPSAQVLWNFGDGSNGTGDTISHSYTQNGTFTINMQATSLGGCLYTATKNVTVASPVGTISYTSGYQCANTAINFNVTSQNVTDFVWDFGDGTTQTNTTGNTTHIYTTPGTYLPILTIKNGANCSVIIKGPDSIRIDKVTAAFTAQPIQACSGTATNFTNTSSAFFGMQQWQWSFGDGGTSALQNPNHNYTTSSTYPVKLVVTGLSGCKDSTTQILNIEIYQLPIAAINANDNVCINTNATFNSSINSVDLITNYNWSLSNGTSFTSPNVTTTFTQLGTVTATLIVETNHGCKDTANRTINVRGNPTVTASNDDFVCSGSGKQLNAVGATSYQWNNAASLSCSTCPSPMAAPTVNTTYTVTGTSQYGCSAKDSVFLRVIDDFTVTANSPSICSGARANLFASGATTYTWSPATGLSSSTIANPTANPTTTTTYTVTGKDSYGCFTRTASATVIINPNSSLYLGKDSVTTIGFDYQFNPTVGISPAVTWSWTPSTGLSCTDCPNPKIEEVRNDVTYIATITNQYGCRTRDTIRITPLCPNAKIFIPNILTPDGDGYNDVMMVRATGIRKVTSVKVFNRWGQMVFNKSDFVPNEKTSAWDGTYKGKLVDPDVFVYVCEVICEGDRIAFYKGNITVIR